MTEGLWSKPEAEVFADEAVLAGVPREEILIESRATNSGENIARTKQLLIEHGITVRSIVAVQKPYMLRRTYAAVRKQWPEVAVTVAAPAISYDAYPTKEIPKAELIHILVGDPQRVRRYAELGYQVPQEIPSEVWDACLELVARGYNRYWLPEA